ncbi:uncharacterized protein BJ212DRAFT_1446932 [Suillus subaureus]|uniref:Uncharacterized protein n=1 Tax=Suillus subaureus TaxID=48587 RepID=A0A9P7EAW2_9AGAM|nr:uncharacterized protein BJ212DRAFT_1446932 [Suillus subaureus]KAG1816374.1 hypothetical protein BJ212DRAFT_1446932 [Suillus subaureus]
MYEAQLIDAKDEKNLYYPFTSKIKWEVAHWAKLRGSSSTVFTDLLSIDGVIVAGESFDVYYHDIIECIKSLYGDPDFARYLTFSPEWHYADDDETVHLFHNMHIGKWWWEMQKKLDAQHPGGTIVPIIISSDKMQVTMFRNIPKELHHKPSSGSHVLLAYLPTSCLKHITNKVSHCRAIVNLYHMCLHCVLAPLIPARTEGISMCSSDGACCHCHPIFASFVSDYPEQLLTTGVKFGECPKCDVNAKDTGSNTMQFHLQKLSEVLDALAAFNDGNLVFVCACAAAGIRPIIHPFWEDLPFTNIFRAITPDVLHQLYQGLIKHLLSWLSAACGGAKIDAHLCGLLDFLYLAQYPYHSSETLHSLDKALDLFHQNKDIFIQLSIHNNFNLPKLHTVHHYHLMITLFGTTDNYNTEYTEHLHIDLAKDAYRTTNHKDNIQKLVEDYGMTHFREALACYIVHKHQGDHSVPLHDRELDHLVGDIHFPFYHLPVFHKIKWCSIDTGGLTKGHVTLDSLGSWLIHRHSDTVFVRLGEDLVTNDLKGFSVGQVQVIFSLPPKSLQLLFPPTVNIPPHLAYIKWFTPFPSAPDQNNRLYKLSRLL